MPESLSRQAMLDDIIERELEMFLSVTNRGGVSSCQERPDTFRTMRWTSHSVQTDSFLASYLADLKEAKEQGRNFMVEKYALMENLIPALSTDPAIKTIVDTEGAWRDALAALYPHVFRVEAGEHFRLYLGSELQTLSPKTLSLYRERIQKAIDDKGNLVLERYENLFHKMGYASIAEREAYLAGQKQNPECCMKK